MHYGELRSLCVLGALRDHIEAATEGFISLWSSPSAVSLSQISRTFAAPFSRIWFWGLLSLCSSLYIFGFGHVWGLRCPCLLFVSRVVRWLQNLHFPRLGATISIIVILWQISFLGIRVGEASNPGPALPDFVPVSDGVTTPLPQPQDQDLEISVSGVVSRPPSFPTVASPPLSFTPAALPYHPAPPVCSPFSLLFLFPVWFCCSPLFQSCPLCSSPQPLPSPGSHFVCCRSVIVSPSCPRSCQDFLSGPLLSRPCSPLSRVGHLRFHALAH